MPAGSCRDVAGAGYPQGLDQADIDQIFDAVLGTWGTGTDLDLIAPTVAANDNFRRWYAQVQRMSPSPATAVAMARQWYEADVRSVLPTESADPGHRQSGSGHFLRSPLALAS
jgi:hypothetical protein